MFFIFYIRNLLLDLRKQLKQTIMKIRDFITGLFIMLFVGLMLLIS